MKGVNIKTDQWIDLHHQEILDQLYSLLHIPSVLGEAEPGAPFGAEIRRALSFTLELCHSLGFTTANMDGMIGYAEYGEGDETVGILCHLDVVGAEGEWICDPFAGLTINGNIIARGIQDDKGPTIAAIYALAAVKAANVPFRRKVRLLFGCDEECQMRCLEHYLKSGEKVPDLSFSPDAEFPVVNGEMHICGAQYEKHYFSHLQIEAGTAANAVPGVAKAIVPVAFDDCTVEVPEGFSVKKEPCAKGTKIVLTGKAAHASVPHLGKNAIQAMLYLLSRLPLPTADMQAVEELIQVFRMDYHGERFGLDVTDASGRLTLNLGVLHWDENGYRIIIDIRAPISLEEETIHTLLRQALTSFCEEQRFRFNPGFYLPDSTELVSLLQEVFTQRYGKKISSIQLGGGTYARKLPNAVSFGPLLPGKPDQCHTTNESMNIDDFFFHVKTTADAIAALATV